MKIVVDSDIPYIKGLLEPFAEVAYLRGAEISAADVRDADALIVRTRTQCDGQLLAGSRVRLIATATIGFDHIDTGYCARSGIGVATAAGSNARGVLQWVAAALMHAAGVEGWRPDGKTIGVVGVGHVGSLVAQYAAQWGFEVVCCDPPRQRVEGPQSPAARFTSLDEIARRSDIVTFHTPLICDGQDATYHMAGRDFFAAVRPGTLIVNSSRGAVVDTPALSDAVERGVCSCIIDTWEHEPDIDRRLSGLSMLATPHIAGYTAQGKANATAMAVQAVAAEFGLPLAGWYPAACVSRIPSRPVSWDELQRTIHDYFDIEALSNRLKSAPTLFETIRNTYLYRTEYF